MNYIAVGSKSNFDSDFVIKSMDSLGLSSKADSIAITSSSPVEDVIAEYAYQNKIPLITEDPDPGLHGNAAREYAIRKMARGSDSMIVFYQNPKDQILKLSDEICRDTSLEVIHFREVD